MDEATRIVITEIVIVMNHISFSLDVMVMSEAPEMTFDLERRSTCTIEDPGVSTHTVLTTLSRIHLG